MYLITGGAGFIGSHLVETLFRDNNFVIIDDLTSGLLSNLNNIKSTQLIQMPVQEVAVKDFESIDGIFHLAAQPSVPVSINNFYESSVNNLLSMLKIWDMAKEFNIPVVYASSSAVYGNLQLGDDQLKKYDILSPYAQDKLTMENYAMMCWEVYKIPSIGLRFFNVYGPRQDPSNPYSGVISIFIDRLMCNKPVVVYGGYQTRDFIYVDNIVQVMIQAMDHLRKKKTCEVLNVGTGMSISIDYLLTVLAKIIDVRPEIYLKPLSEGDPEQSHGTYKKLKNILNINTEKFVKLKDGLSRTIEFVRKNQNL